MQPEICKFLYDAQSACEALMEFTHDKSLSDYQRDLLLRAGVEREFEIIGEALNQALKIDPVLGKTISNIRQIINLRNVIIHGYSLIENETIWGLIQNDLPKLYEQVRVMLEEQSGK